MDKKVSIIVPIYNVEKYIDHCIRSLLSQDYQNIELILVDDGSPDSSGAIADKYQLSDNRVVVVHKKNAGVSSARNAGLSIASGDYVMFVDGDDWVEPNYVSFFVDVLKKDNTRIALNKNNYYLNDKKTRGKHYIKKAEKAIEWIYTGDIFVAVWNKIYDLNIIKDNNLFFDESIWYGEGMLFNIAILQFVDSVSICEENVYHQVFNSQSAMRKFDVRNNVCGIRSLELQKSIWKKKNRRIYLAWKYHKECFNATTIDGLVRTNAVDKYPDLYKECKKNIKKNIFVLFFVAKGVKKKLAWIAYFVFPKLMAVRHAKQYKQSSTSV